MEFSDVLAVRAPTRFSLAGGFALAVVVASMVHAPAEPLSNPGPLGLFRVDKWIHFGSYAVLAFLGAYVVLTRSVVVLLGVALATTLFGAGVELLQGTVAWRSMETADVLANAAGAVLAVVVWRLAWAALPGEGVPSPDE